jgi:hypothetical protein
MGERSSDAHRAAAALGASSGRGGELLVQLADLGLDAEPRVQVQRTLQVVQRLRRGGLAQRQAEGLVELGAYLIGHVAPVGELADA